MGEAELGALQNNGSHKNHQECKVNQKGLICNKVLNNGDILQYGNPELIKSLDAGIRKSAVGMEDCAQQVCRYADAEGIHRKSANNIITAHFDAQHAVKQIHKDTACNGTEDTNQGASGKIAADNTGKGAYQHTALVGNVSGTGSFAVNSPQRTQQNGGHYPENRSDNTCRNHSLPLPSFFLKSNTFRVLTDTKQMISA